jgi:O-antigen biosynthesis protein WbqV
VAGAALIQGTFLSALRVIRRSLHERMLLDSVLRLGPASMPPALPRLLIVGSANEAEAFLRAPAGLGERYAPIGVVSPLDRETGDELRGVCVLGAIADFDRVLARLRDSGLPPSAILFLTDSAMSTFGAERLGRLKTEGVRLLRRHGVVEMGAGRQRPRPCARSASRSCSAVRPCAWIPSPSAPWSRAAACWSPGPAAASARSCAARSPPAAAPS